MSPWPHADLEFAPAEAARRTQEALLREHVAHCAANSPFYRDLLRTADARPEDVTLATLDRLPCTGKEDLEARNDEFLAVPRGAVIDIVQSSGTTGAPTRIMYTAADLKRLAYNEKLSFIGVGLGPADTVLLTCTMDRCFVAGLAYFLGLWELGAAAVRNGHGTLEGHRGILERMHPTAIVGVPSFLRKLASYLSAQGADAAACTVTRLICIGEPTRDVELQPLPVGRELAELWGAQVFSTYASSETITTFCECEAGAGGHLHPDLAILEIIDEEGAPVPEGEVGEVVVTPLGVEGMPLLRFRTGDLSFARYEPCSCGRYSPRLGPILARRKQMLKVKGTTLYPQAIALALDDLDGVGEHYVEVSRFDELSDAVEVHLCVHDTSLASADIEEFLVGRLRVRPKVVIETETAIRKRVFSPQYRKPMRFYDKRSS